MKKVLESVSEFHNEFGQPILPSPEVPSNGRVQLRCSLIQEELNELKEASKRKDIVECVDALGDILYVLAGTILEYGVQDKIEEAFSKIHESNMSKACKTWEEAKETQEYYLKKKKYKSSIKQSDSVFLVIREDGKLLKSINYKPVNIKKVLGYE